MAITQAESDIKELTKTEPSWPPKPEHDPASVAAMRERRLAASMPKTLHVLRNTDRGAMLLAYGEELGCAKWQVEQSICNIRSIEFLSYHPSSVTKRLSMIEAVRNYVVEPASMNVDLERITVDELAKQIKLDAAYLLRRAEPHREITVSISECIRRIQELGYG